MSIMKEDLGPVSPEKKKRTPRNVDSILIGVLALSLADKVRLRNELTKAIDDELATKEAELKEVKEIVNGKQH